ncbi:hypothetical protein ABZ281_37495, partial [Streptomyces sp. NPDC006265]|uniref:hypothetical protein n=1 Tax=Streptomyces sp. NPDC006265 TaxID=3156740 RepID=UPI0033B5B205
ARRVVRLPLAAPQHGPDPAKVPEELGHLAGDLYEQAPGAPGSDDPTDSPDPDPDPDQEPGTEPPVPAEGAEK